MGFFSWIIVGALSGWIASIIMKKDGQMGFIANIVVGIIGANIGGFLARFPHIGGRANGINLYSIFISVIGAMVLLYLIDMINKRR